MQGAVGSRLTHHSIILLTNSQCESILFWGWLGGYKYEDGVVQCGRLLTIEELGEIFKSTSRRTHHVCTPNVQTVPVNLKDRDEFHLSLEEYLHSLMTLVEELVRRLICVANEQEYIANNYRHALPAMLSLWAITSVRCSSTSSSRICMLDSRSSTLRMTAYAAAAMASSIASRMWRTWCTIFH